MIMTQRTSTHVHTHTEIDAFTPLHLLFSENTKDLHAEGQLLHTAIMSFYYFSQVENNRASAEQALAIDTS